VREANVRIYFDADILGLAHIIVALRRDCTYPGHPGDVLHKQRRPPCVVHDKATNDTEWVPLVTRHAMIIISRDHKVRDNPAERRTVRECGARMLALSGEDARTKWGQLELFMQRWRRIEALHEEQGPFIYIASRSRLSDSTCAADHD
jgi:PIN like domain